MTAYDETYLSGAQRRLGAMLDFAVHGLEVGVASAYAAFLASPLSRRFAAGDPAIVAGRSGEELALEILGSDIAGATALCETDPRAAGPCETPPKAEGLQIAEPQAAGMRVAGPRIPSPCEPAPRETPSVGSWLPSETATPEYWTGWALAFYQWASGYSFAAIDERVRIDDIKSLYAPFHEMDVRQLCDRLDELCAQAHPQTNLQARRLAAGLSQSQLARASNVPVRTLQQYEQRQKNINRARADYVAALARALCCSPADLLEHSARSGCEYAFVTL